METMVFQMKNTQLCS